MTPSAALWWKRAGIAGLVIAVWPLPLFALLLWLGRNWNKGYRK